MTGEITAIEGFVGGSEKYFRESKERAYRWTGENILRGIQYLTIELILGRQTHIW